MKFVRSVLLSLSLLLPFAIVASSPSWAESKLAATIFSYDGNDFVRTNSTLTDNGKSVVGTKLDHDSAAYTALTKHHSYTGQATLFGRDYEANYAPLVDEDGKLIGALFVAFPK